MSKASEFKKALAVANNLQPDGFNVGKENKASVTDNGELYLKPTVMRTKNALELAAWIIETFGDPE